MKDMQTLERLEELVNRELGKNVDKGSLNPAEIDSVNKAVTVLEKIESIHKICEERRAMNQSSDMSSGAFYNIRNYPNPMSGGSSYGWDEQMTSGRSMRNPMTGRYMSYGYDGGMSYANQGSQSSQRDNYSGHSVNDRMVDALERMMDSAKSEFEKQQILDKIKMIRNSPDQMG